MILIKRKNECEVCNSYRISTQEKINPQGPQIESNLIFMCDKCKDKYQNRTLFQSWLYAVKQQISTTQS